MTHRLTTNCAKNYCNRTLIVKVIVENVVTCFWGTQCTVRRVSVCIFVCEACGFVYESTMSSNGTFTSPNFPGFYPCNTVCHYLFHGRENERVVINFPYFDVEGIWPRSVFEAHTHGASKSTCAEC